MSSSADINGRRVSMLTAVSVVVASMVGTGVFTSLGYQIRDIPAGFPILVLWIIGGVVSLCGAFCYAELVCMNPRSGGEYHLLSTSLHPLAGFLAGWISITAGFAAPLAAAAVVFGTYLHAIWPAWNIHVYGSVLVLTMALVQLFSLRFVERFQVAFTVMKLALIAAFITGAISMGAGNWSLLLPAPNDSGHYTSQSYAIALVFVMYAYTGWNGAVYVAGEMADARRHLPKALLIGTVLVMVLYVFLNAAFMVSAPWSALEGKPEVALMAARAIFGEEGGNGMGIIISFGLIAHISAMLFAGTRVLRVLGQDVWYLRGLDKTNRAGSPWIAVILLTVVVFALMLSGTFEQLLLYIQGLLLLSSMLCVAAVPWLRCKRPDAARPFRVPLYPLTPIIYLGVTSWMLYALVMERPKESLLGLLTLLLGLILFYVARLKKPDVAV